MPLIDGSDFIPSGRYRNGHYSTIVPHLLGKKPTVKYQRIRIDTPDNDFLDLDYVTSGHQRLLLLCHGLEGNSQSGYVLSYAHYFNNNGWDILALNYRGCSGVPNLRLQMYNSGSTEDLHLAIYDRIKEYDEICLLGFSLGGNLVLKYIGEEVFDITPKLKAVIAISAPLHLEDASRQLLKWDNTLYQWRFLLSLSNKIIQKKRQYPDDIRRRKLLKCRSLYKFDDHFTAPLFGYRDAAEYYAKNQSIQWLENIKIPSLIINAEDDPFLGPKCYPKELIRGLDDVSLCTPRYGGHVGFSYSRHDQSWIFNKVASFINKPPI